MHAVLLINLGTPEDLTVAAVRRFLAEFLSDPDVIRMPRLFRWCNPIVGHLIAWFRARHALEMYATIWTDEGSPLRILLERQRAALEQELGEPYRVYTAVRYGRPAIVSQLERLVQDGAESVTILPLYPQYSGGTTGSVLRKVGVWLKRHRPATQVHVLSSWQDEPAFHRAQAELLRETLQRHGWTSEDSFLLFSAHSIPVSHVANGDPYPEHVEASARGVARQLEWPEGRWKVAYQSRFGPTEWLSPSTEDAAARLCADGVRRIIVCPISFTADCLETLEELGKRLAEQIESAGAEMALCPALNDAPAFIAAMAEWVRRHHADVSPSGHASSRTVSSSPVSANPESPQVRS